MDSPGFSMVWPGNGFQFTIGMSEAPVLDSDFESYYGWHMKPFTEVLPHLPKPLASRRSGWGGFGHKKVQMTR